MAVGEFTKYGVVLASSLTGAASGFAYSSKALNLRSRLEGSGKKLLRPSDPSWLYQRILTQKKEKIKEIMDKPENTELKKLKEFVEDKNKMEPSTEQIIVLTNWCQEKLTEAKYNSWSYADDVNELCEYPDWDKEE